jgi:transposase, IS30 family
MENLKRTDEKVYKHLQSNKRDEIGCMLSEGYTKKDIADHLKRHPSTISREIERNGSPINETCYRANRAQMRADDRKKISHCKKRLKMKR